MPEQRSPSMQFYFRQFAGDERVMAMDLEAIGAHILMMCAAGASPQGYKLPADERILCNIIRVQKNAKWERIKCQLLEGPWKISRDKRWWIQNGMKRSMQKQKVFRDEQKRKSKLANDKRWGHPHGDNLGTSGGIPQRPSSSSPALASSSSSQKPLAHAVSSRSAEPREETAGARPTSSQVQEALGKIAKQLDPKANRNGGIRAHIEAGIFRKKIEAAYFDATDGGIAPAECILQAVNEGALSLCGNRSVELKGLTHGELAEMAWAKIAPSAETISSMKTFEARSRQVVAIATRCVTDAAMEFLAERKGG